MIGSNRYHYLGAHRSAVATTVALQKISVSTGALNVALGSNNPQFANVIAGSEISSMPVSSPSLRSIPRIR